MIYKYSYDAINKTSSVFTDEKTEEGLYCVTKVQWDKGIFYKSIVTKVIVESLLILMNVVVLLSVDFTLYSFV